LKLHVLRDATSTGKAAAARATALLRARLETHDSCRLVFATGASQFALLEALLAEPLPWHRITAFHLDEYLGLSPEHPASFCNYLQQRVASKVKFAEFHFINGLTPDPGSECERLSQLVSVAPIDLALIGIGENGHLAFNDPPADFQTRVPYHVVELDEACRRQQLGEGWFTTLEQVPTRAISMSIQQILSSHRLICTVPDTRKAKAVAAAIDGPESPQLPASILRRHPALDLYLDAGSASLLKDSPDFETLSP
jgi:glucosamine-6-phosphate deaminase